MRGRMTWFSGLWLENSSKSQACWGEAGAESQISLKSAQLGRICEAGSCCRRLLHSFSRTYAGVASPSKAVERTWEKKPEALNLPVAQLFQDCVQNAEEKGFAVTITKEVNVSDVEYCKVILYYDLSLPLFGKVYGTFVTSYVWL